MEDKYAAQPEQEIAPKTPDADDVDALLQDVKSLLGESDGETAEQPPPEDEPVPEGPGSEPLNAEDVHIDYGKFYGPEEQKEPEAPLTFYEQSKPAYQRARRAEYERIRGLDLGADYYLVKPFGVMELVSCVKAVLRRSSAKEEENKGVYDFDNLHLDMNRYELKVKGKVVEAPPKELELLACLAGHPNRVYTRDQLLDEVWGFEYYGDSRTIDVHVKRLREKLEGASEQWSLKTVWGVGYKFEVRE